MGTERVRPKTSTMLFFASMAVVMVSLGLAFLQTEGGLRRLVPLAVLIVVVLGLSLLVVLRGHSERRRDVQLGVFWGATLAVSILLVFGTLISPLAMVLAGLGVLLYIRDVAAVRQFSLLRFVVGSAVGFFLIIPATAIPIG